MKHLIHIAIRISDQTYNLPSTVIRHNLVSCRHDMVWLGKPDRGLSKGLVELLNEQINQGHTTYLLIIDPDHANPILHHAELQAVSLKSPSEKGLIPGFYRELKLLSRIKTWFKVGDLASCRLDDYPALVQANAEYETQELACLQMGVEEKKLFGYFTLEQTL